MGEDPSRTQLGNSDAPGEGSDGTSRAPTDGHPVVPDGTSDPVHVSIPKFQYRYPDDIPAIDQEAIETIRAEANRKISLKWAQSFQELIEARFAWLREVAAGAAVVLGRLAAREHWGANRRRDVLRDFAIQAACAAQLTYLAAQRFFKSDEWKELDSVLFPPLAGDGIDPQLIDSEGMRDTGRMVDSADRSQTASESRTDAGDQQMGDSDSTALGSITLDAFEDPNTPPLGDNPFPAGHPAHAAFEEVEGATPSQA